MCLQFLLRQRAIPHAHLIIHRFGDGTVTIRALPQYQLPLARTPLQIDCHCALQRAIDVEMHCFAIIAHRQMIPGILFKTASALLDRPSPLRTLCDIHVSRHFALLDLKTIMPMIALMPVLRQQIATPRRLQAFRDLHPALDRHFRRLQTRVMRHLPRLFDHTEAIFNDPLVPTLSVNQARREVGGQAQRLRPSEQTQRAIHAQMAPLRILKSQAQQLIMLHHPTRLPQPRFLKVIRDLSVARRTSHRAKDRALRLQFNRQLNRLQLLQPLRPRLQCFGIVQRLCERAQARLC